MQLSASSHRFRLTVGALAVFILLAAFLRLYRLGEIPPALFFDEAGQGVDSLEVLAGRRSIFFERSITKEPLFVYLTVPFVALLERGPWAVRLPAALVGIATVPGVFFLVRELLVDEGKAWATAVALLAAGLLAGSFWAVLVNRMAFRVNTVPLVMAIAFALIWRTYRLGGIPLAISAGAALGLCFYTYLSARFAYPLALLVFGFLALTQAGRIRLRERRRELLWMATTCLLVMLPLGLYFWTHPDDFLRRAGMVVTGTTGEDPYLMQLARSFLFQFGMFGGPGDPQIRHNLPDRSILSPWLAILFWSGVALALWRFRRPGRMVAVLWLVVMLLPAILSVSDPRHMLRAFSVLPVVYFFPALALGDGWGWLTTRQFAVSKTTVTRIMLVLAVGLIGVEALLTWRTYFGQWANLPELPRAYRQVDTTIAEEINRSPAHVGYVVPMASLWWELGGNYTLDYLIERPEQVLMLYPDRPDAGEKLLRFLARPDLEEIRLVRYTWAQDAEADPRELLPLLTDLVAEPIDSREETDYMVHSYALPGKRLSPSNLPAMAPLDLTFSANAGAEVQVNGLQHLAPTSPAGDVPSGGDGAIGLAWQLTEPSQEELRLSLRLLDGLGNSVGQADSLLVQAGELTETEGAQLTYHPIHVAPGTPPGSYGLELLIYDPSTGARLALAGATDAPRDAAVVGTVQVGMPDASGTAYAPAAILEQPVEIVADLTLLGEELTNRTGQPGLPLDLALAWRSADPTVASNVQFRLGDETIGQETLQLPAGGPWRTTHRLYVPPHFRAGAYELSIAGALAEAQLGTFTVDEPGLPPEMPAGRPPFRFADGIELVAWSADPLLAEVALYWRAADTEPRPDYTVFVHVVDSDEQIVAQDNAEPAGGRYPTSSWPAGATIVDHHTPVHQGRLDPEALCIRVGLYLAGSGRRLPLLSGGDVAELSANCRD